MERLRGNATVTGILGGITTAVVGVIANLALYFAVHTFFSETSPLTWGPLNVNLPLPGSVNLAAVLIAGAAALMIFTLRLSTLKTLGACALLGLIIGLAGLPLG